MIRWRAYQPTDYAALCERHAEQCRATGVSFVFPNLDDPRCLLTEVAVDDDGVIRGALVAHATIELMFIGADAAVARSAVRAKEQLRGDLADKGADEAHAFIPNALLGGMSPILKRLGFRRSNPDYTPYYREL